jgi:hypothetical protein
MHQNLPTTRHGRRPELLWRPARGATACCLPPADEPRPSAARPCPWRSSDHVPRPSRRSSSSSLCLVVDWRHPLDLRPWCSNDCAVAREERNGSPGARATPDRAASPTGGIEHRRLRASSTTPRAPSSPEHRSGSLEAKLHQGQSLAPPLDLRGNGPTTPDPA